ncbi:hypothetical protein J2X46_002772 [Nocardioides sp. BE266]|uniref:hypothetical protein n=1 Tax=Nocardioides sp. BE266 TaxID=2817725 RepID=UPI002854BE30|nr:hypothetical protein [Nocardioides sp. BE266]MDR7253782.1 hypothetical protein [Nocardioides sp. BE266]
MSPWGQPPRWFVWLCAAVVVAGTVVTVVGTVRIGITVDETFHVVRLRNYLDQGWYLLDDDLRAGRPGAWVTDSYVYAPVAALFLHVLNVVVGNEAWSEVSTSTGAYVVRHLGVAFLAACTLGATAVVTRLVSASWRWAVVACAVVAALPMWSGHAMFNVKDVPVAAGYTFVTLACMLLVVGERTARRRRAAVVALLLLGVVLAVGTRPAIWPGLAAAVGLLVLASWRPARWWRVVDAAVGVLGGLAVLAAVYPSVFLHPLRWALGATSESAGYQGVRFWGYIPLYVMCTVPVVLLLFGLAGSFVRFRGRVATRRDGWGARDLLMGLVVSQALLLPVLLMIRVPSLNGGLRHLLFAAPAVAVLIAAGIAQVVGDAPGRRGQGVVTAFAAVGLVVPVGAQVQLFPLGYAYANPLSDAAGLGLAGDFWQASFREYADVVPDGAWVICGAKLDDDAHPLREMPNGGQSWLEVGRDCAAPGVTSVLEPFLSSGRKAAGDEVAGDFVAFVVYDDPMPEGCREIGRVTRHRLVTEVVASRALLCPLVLPDYVGPITLDGEGRGATYLLGGWSGDGGEREITVEDRASLGFHVDAPYDDDAIRVEGSADGDIEFLVNNVPAQTESSADGWLVQPPASLPELGEPGNLVLTVVPTDGAARVSHVEVEEVVG